MRESVSETTGTIRVLHVDDEPDFADLAATFLEREDERFEVETATSPSDGLDRLSETPYDCVVSDYDMPGQNGIEFLEAVRENNPEIPFILFTGKGSEEIASDAISAGVSDYLQKGSGTERYSLLANRIGNLISQYRAKSQLETRAKQQRRVAELGNEALAGASLETLFNRAAELVADTLDNEYAKVLDYPPEHEDLLLRAGVGWRDDLVGEATVGTDEDSQAGHTIRSEQPIVVEDLRTEERFCGPPLLVEHNVVSGISVIIGSVDDPWGVLGTHTTEHTIFTDDDITFVQSVANILANAIERRDHERELERKDRAMDEAPVGITITDPSQEDNPLIYANDRFTELTGYAEDEAVGSNCRFLQGEHTDPDPVAQMREAIDAEEPVTVELRNYSKDGTEFWNRVSIAPVRNDEGAVTNYVGFQRDVTNDKERNRELEEINAILTRLFETLPVGILVEDASRNILTANKRLFELFEMPGTPDEVVGADCERMADQVSDMFTDPEGFIECINRLVVNRETTDNEELALTDGRTFERSHRPIEFPGGGGHLWVYQDSTERKRQEQERVTTIEFLQTLYGIATDRELTADEKITRVLELGPEKLGLPHGHLTRIDRSGDGEEDGTQTVIEASGDHELLQPGATCPLSQSYCRKTIEQEGLLEIQDALAAGWADDPAYGTFELGCYIGTAVTVNDELYGTVFFASDSPREDPFTDAERTFVQLMSQLVSYELEHRQATSELERQNEQLEEFASVVSHDLLNPLQVAEGRLELAREEHDSEHLDAVARAHERIDALIDDLLTLAREGKQVNELEPVDMGILTENCWQNVATTDGTLMADVERTFQADRSRLQQLLENLMHNAVEHGGGDVTITVGELDGGFYVEDDGPGIPDDKRDDIFEAGYSTAEDGTGFGLSIVKQVAEAHDWHVRVTDGSDGGARFEITGVESTAE
ncbi:PAS domain-containing protein [Halobaculum saliterrae]|nr:PAS domain-containing protein [Halobaculum saliterrae]